MGPHSAHSAVRHLRGGAWSGGLVPQVLDAVVVGGGRAGLAARHHLRRRKLDFVVLAAQPTPGGAWQYAWDSLQPFSPAAFSSLSSRLMPAQV